MRIPFTITTTAIALAFLASHAADASPPKFDPTDVRAYRIALAKSHDPDAARIRKEIANGPSALANAVKAAEAARIGLSGPPPLPSDQNALTIDHQWATVRGKYPAFAEPLSLKYQYTPEQIEAAQKIVDEHPDADALLSKAINMPVLRFSNDGSNSFPEWAAMRSPSRQIMTEATLIELNGEPITAALKQVEGFKVFAQIVQQCNIVQFLIAGAIESDTIAGLRRILGRSPPNVNLASVVENSGIASEDIGLLARVVKGEALVEWEMNKSYSALVLKSATSNSGGLNFKPLPTLKVGDQRFAANIYDAVMASELLDTLVDLRLANEPRLNRPTDFAKHERDLNAKFVSNPNDPITVLSAPLVWHNYSRMSTFDDIWLARRRTTLAACAVLKVKAQTGAYPKSLPGTFLDPFSDKPLVYKLTDSGFMIYSVGPENDCDGTVKQPVGEQAIFQYPAPAPIPLPSYMLEKPSK